MEELGSTSPPATVINQSRIFEALDMVSTSAQGVVSLLADLISAHFPADKGKTATAVPTESVVAVSFTIWSNY